MANLKRSGFRVGSTAWARATRILVREERADTVRLLPRLRGLEPRECVACVP